MPPLGPGSSITISMLPTGGLTVTASPGVVTPGASGASSILSAPPQLGGPAGGPPSIWAILTQMTAAQAASALLTLPPATQLAIRAFVSMNPSEEEAMHIIRVTREGLGHHVHSAMTAFSVVAPLEFGQIVALMKLIAVDGSFQPRDLPMVERAKLVRHLCGMIPYLSTFRRPSRLDWLPEPLISALRTWELDSTNRAKLSTAIFSEEGYLSPFSPISMDHVVHFLYDLRTVQALVVMLKATRPHSQMDNRASLKATIVSAANGPLSAATSQPRLQNLKDDISAVCGFMGPASLRGEEARTFVIDANEGSRVVTSALIDTLYSSSPTQMEVIITPSDPRVARWTVADFIQCIVDTLIASLQAARSLSLQRRIAPPGVSLASYDRDHRAPSPTGATRVRAVVGAMVAASEVVAASLLTLRAILLTRHKGAAGVA